MSSNNHTGSVSKGRLWAGRIIGGLPALFLLVDAIMKFIKPVPVVEETVRLGYPESVIIGLGAVLLASTILYLIPKPWRDPVNRVPRWGGGYTCQNVRGLVSDPIPCDFWCAALGGTMAARWTLATADSRTRLRLSFLNTARTV